MAINYIVVTGKRNCSRTFQFLYFIVSCVLYQNLHVQQPTSDLVNLPLTTILGLNCNLYTEINIYYEDCGCILQVINSFGWTSSTYQYPNKSFEKSCHFTQLTFDRFAVASLMGNQGVFPWGN